MPTTTATDEWLDKLFGYGLGVECPAEDARGLAARCLKEFGETINVRRVDWCGLGFEDGSREYLIEAVLRTDGSMRSIIVKLAE